jgi:hypothetical protein
MGRNSKIAKIRGKWMLSFASDLINIPMYTPSMTIPNGDGKSIKNSNSIQNSKIFWGVRLCESFSTSMFYYNVYL